jgi:ABC-type transporter Mla subunit MlaD
MNDILSRLAIFIDANTEGFQRGLARSQQSLLSLEKTIGSIQKTFAGLGVSFGAFAVAGVIGDAIKSIAELEQELSVVKAITGATGEEFQALRKNALDLGASTKYTAQEVASLQVEYGRLGFTTREILAATGATLDLATATGEDLARSADVAGSTLRGFGLDASEIQRVTDVMAESFNRSALGLDNFAEAIKYVAPDAHAAGISIEQVTALLGKLADNGIRGSQAGTSLRKIITDLAKDGRPLNERLDELAKKGITVADAFDEVGRTAQSSLIVLTNNRKEVGQLEKALDNAAGATRRVADIMNDNLIGDVTKLSSAYDGLVQTGGQLSGVLRGIVQDLTKLVTAFGSASTASDSFFAKYINWITTIPRYTIKGIAAVSDALTNTIDTADEARAYLETLREPLNEAKLAGNGRAVQLYTSIIINLTKKFGLLNDKAVEYKDKVENNPPKPPVGLIEALENQIAELTQAQKTAFDPKAIQKFNDQLAAANEELERLKSLRTFRVEVDSSSLGKVKKDLDFLADFGLGDQSGGTALKTKPLTFAPTIEPGIIASLEAQIQRVEEARRKAFDPADIQRFNTEIFNLQSGLNKLQAKVIDLGPVIAQSITTIAEGIGQAFAGTANFGDALLKAAADFAQQFGAILVAVGIGEVAFQASGANPVALIAAGAALVALGAAAKAKINSTSKGITGAASGAASTGARANQQSSAPSGLQDQQLVADVVIRGQDLWVVFSNYQKNSRQTKVTNG